MPRRLAFALVLVLAAACAGPGQGDDRVAVAAGSAAQEVPAPTSTSQPAPAPTTSTTQRPAPTTTSTTRAPAPPTTARPAPAPTRPRGPYPPGVSGTTLSATTTAGDTTLTMKLFPADQYFGENIQVRMELATRDAVRSVKVDFGNGTVVDATPPAFTCPGAVRALNPGAPTYTYPAPGRYVVRAIVTSAPCVPFPATPPPGFPSEVPDPLHPDRVVEVAITFDQAPDRPPPPVGPPPGA